MSRANSGERNEKKQQMIGQQYQIGSEQFDDMRRVMYLGGGATEEDMTRWYEQGFEFCQSPGFGLKQSSGGPCGILAVVQAEIIKQLLFDNENSNELDHFPVVSKRELEILLAKAIVSVLLRASDGFICIVNPCQGKMNSFVFDQFYSEQDANDFLLNSLEVFQSKSGCLLFLMSLVLTRGIANLQTDMDDPGNTLIGQFGHCNQDLINLLLTGRATSNVMDGEMPMGDTGLMVRGVQQRCTIGYLTHLEALRYCQVGNFLKVPHLPIWVIGSSSHFSVLFSRDRQINAESQSERVMSVLQRCFKAMDPDECGYILADRFKNVLEMVAAESGNSYIAGVLQSETDLARLRGHLRVDGEIIIWSRFWESLSQVMLGTPMDAIITVPPELLVEDTKEAASSSGPVSKVADLDFSALLGAPANKSRAQQQNRKRSDSEMARALQEALDRGDEEFVMRALAEGSENVEVVHPEPARPEPQQQERKRSDSEIARELQAMLDRGEDISDAILFPELGPVDLTIGPPVVAPQRPSSPETKVSALAPLPGSSSSSSGSDGSIMYHFNGLETASRRAKLTTFKLTPRSTLHTIGQSVAFDGHEGFAGGFFCPIEEVLRTRWPECKIDWFGDVPPSID